MPRINAELLGRLARKLGVTPARVYARIAETASRTMLDHHLAALVLASENGVNIQKYSTNAERAQVRGTLIPNVAQVGGPVPDSGTERRTGRPARSTKGPKSAKPSDNSVFVVHGRNDKLRKAPFDFLRALGLKPLEWEKAVLMTKRANPYIGDILDVAMAKVQAVVVLFSPDDEARLKWQLLAKSDGASEKQLRGQPRPNVLFEAGLALGRHPEKTILVEVGRLRKFSDIVGRHVVKLTNDYSKRNDLANRLEALGCKVDRQGTDWTTSGDFRA